MSVKRRLRHDDQPHAGQVQRGRVSTGIDDLAQRRDTDGIVAVAGKVAKAALDGERPLHMLNVLLHDLQAVVGLSARRNGAGGALQYWSGVYTYPMLRLITGDAIFAQRPLIDLRGFGST